MNRISALEQKIRDDSNNGNLYERLFADHPDEWNALCVAMDTLGDTCLALKYYQDFGIGNEEGEKYLKLYGLLQAVFLQQDAIRQLYETFLKTELRPHAGSFWMRIRELRNLTVGHPIEKGKTDTKRCFISRVTIHSGGFQLIVWDKAELRNDFENVDLRSIYESYKSEAIGHLQCIHQAQVNFMQYVGKKERW